VWTYANRSTAILPTEYLMIRAPHTSISFALRLLFLTAFFGIVGTVAAAPVIWTGPDISFSKASGADPTLAENQDRLTDNVWLTRNNSQGIFNALPTSGDCDGSDCFFNHGLSPAGTLWATSLTSPGEDITASNWSALTFTSWEDSYGASGSLQFNITSHPAVVHLISDDIYLNLTFTAWGSHGAGNFAYTRSTAATSPVPTGDYNGNGVVDAADYTIWRGTLGQTVTSGAGADGNGNGMIDSGDYDFWKSRFGNLTAGAGSGAALSAAVPEPTSLVLSALGGLMLAALSAGRQIRERKA
jgi:hypothetical protein